MDISKHLKIIQQNLELICRQIVEDRNDEVEPMMNLYWDLEGDEDLISTMVHYENDKQKARQFTRIKQIMDALDPQIATFTCEAWATTHPSSKRWFFGKPSLDPQRQEIVTSIIRVRDEHGNKKKYFGQGNISRVATPLGERRKLGPFSWMDSKDSSGKLTESFE